VAVSRPLRTNLPAIEGGKPAFPEGLPLARPAVGDIERIMERVRGILMGGRLTNGGHVQELETLSAEYLGVRHCVAVSSCTSGLMLALRAGEVSGDVVVPSFTFAATVHAAVWNGLRPVFADIDPKTLTLSPKSVRKVMGIGTGGIVATHVFGTPAAVEALQGLARENGVRLVFDAAHAFGSRRKDAFIGGFGDAEVFSLTPTKVVTGSEGGIIATNDDLLAERCRIGRDYGNPGDYDALFAGLSARLSEVHAAIAVESLAGLEERLAERNALAEAYRSALGSVPGLTFPTVSKGDRSTYKDFTVLVDRRAFGMDPVELADALDAEGIETKRYYTPPVHTMKAYRAAAGSNGHLPVTQRISARVLTLPLWNGMTSENAGRVAEAIVRIHVHMGAKSRRRQRRKDTSNG
jgi:dTDP-4-amino-4,6-dideoxygalactose transaminase